MCHHNHRFILQKSLNNDIELFIRIYAIISSSPMSTLTSPFIKDDAGIYSVTMCREKWAKEGKLQKGKLDGAGRWRRRRGTNDGRQREVAAVSWARWITMLVGCTGSRVGGNDSGVCGQYKIGVFQILSSVRILLITSLYTMEPL